MKKNYDVLVVGSGPVGIMFARMMGEKGFRVAVIDKLPREKLGERLDVFHSDEARFEPYGLKPPQPGDPDYADRFDLGLYRSAFNRHEKQSHYPVLLLKFKPFLARMRQWAQETGVEFFYKTEFLDFVYDQEGRIHGARLQNTRGELAVNARLVADCSGIPSAARRKVKSGTVEPFEITPRDMFYVVLHYMKLKHPEKDAVTSPVHYSHYKSWIGQTGQKGSCLFGTGANLSYEYAERCSAKFRESVPLPECEGEYKHEQGVTPYRRPPYSLVTDGFLCIGDAACMTKPFSGEGIASAWVGCECAAAAASKAMAGGAYPTEAALWEYNLSYARGQGADFAFMSAVLANAGEGGPAEEDYMYAHDIVFSSEALTHTNRYYNYDMALPEALRLVGRLIVGVVTGNISLGSLRNMIRGLYYGTLLKAHYKQYPAGPAGFEAWRAKAERLWDKAGHIADAVERMMADSGETVRLLRQTAEI
ncbi:MAG: FAD-dependent monooxygenase [Oscillospiraceae bacterium]|nr:FAD-dependent monooxygenase [Oscillospiraceae bacterium]